MCQITKVARGVHLTLITFHKQLSLFACSVRIILSYMKRIHAWHSAHSDAAEYLSLEYHMTGSP